MLAVTANGTSPYREGHPSAAADGRLDHEDEAHPGGRVPVYGFGLFISNPPGDANCFVLSGGVTVSANVWFNGSFCPNGGASLTPPPADNKYPVYVGGNYLGRTTRTSGRPRPVLAGHIVGICTKRGTVETCSDSAKSGVWANPPYLTSGSC